jgi:hypothetical protein
LVRNILEASVDIKNFLPKVLVLLVVEEVKLGRGVYFFKLTHSTPENLMGKVEEELSEDHQVPMVEGEIEAGVFTTCRMRSDQDIM